MKKILGMFGTGEFWYRAVLIAAAVFLFFAFRGWRVKDDKSKVEKVEAAEKIEKVVETKAEEVEVEVAGKSRFALDASASVEGELFQGGKRTTFVYVVRDTLTGARYVVVESRNGVAMSRMEADDDDGR